MVLSGAVNKQLAHLITTAGAEADVRGVVFRARTRG